MASKPVRSRLNWANILWLALAYTAIALLWETPFVYPLRILVVFLHEISHGLMAVITGGRIVELQVYAQEGGHCITDGGNRFLILSAGYLGSLIFGAGILLTATRSRFPPLVAASLGLLLVYVSAAYVPVADNPFGKFFGIAVGGALAYLALLPIAWSRSALLIIGLTSCLYAIVDIKADILDRSDVLSDASALAADTGLPAEAWGLLWIVISGVVTCLVVRWSVVKDPNAERNAKSPPVSSPPSRRGRKTS